MISMTHDINNSDRIFGLDFMRTTAILMVLCSHILGLYPDSDTFISKVFLLFGLWGVEIFFVLSGFLIGRILYKQFVLNTFSFHSFYVFINRRWFRTLPNYFLILIINLILAYFIGFNSTNFGLYFVFLQNFSYPMKPFFPESWSLSVEEFTYFFIPIILLLSIYFPKVNHKSRQFIGIIVALILLFFINKIIYNYTTLNTTLKSWHLDLKAVVIYRVDSILFGIAAAWISFNYSNFWKNKKNPAAAFGFILLLICYLTIWIFEITIEKSPFFWNVLLLPLTSISFAMMLAFFSEWKTTRWKFAKPITFISLISYSIYLVHYSIVLKLITYFKCFNSTNYMVLHLRTFFFLVITFGLSYLLYIFFEKPIMNLKAKN